MCKLFAEVNVRNTKVLLLGNKFLHRISIIYITFQITNTNRCCFAARANNLNFYVTYEESAAHIIKNKKAKSITNRKTCYWLIIVK